ncbi:hypothetical protein UCRPC4_g06401 [Phaeomoniella chlamydospora]|uniref:DNA mismatch repair protein HSM3 N-terminal domain-containing protein n=1 Tax=Phaeomoniella chlamydospora TaxID=158046 RepID=A0A0G2GDW2_PHACM|nr:hypothetical protein UCRPC4_g06401 [Phaeomoniella chlamydospora]
MQEDPRLRLLNEVHAHLSTLASEPAAKLDSSLLERCQTVLSSEIPHDYLVRVQADAISTFRSLQDDPKVLSDLAVKAASFITFADVQTFLKHEDILEGLQAPLPAVSFLALIYLHKASDSPADTASIASTPGLVEALVRLWLSSLETFISEKAFHTLCSLLETDLPYRSTFVNKPDEGRVGTASGQGLVWRRLFHDKDVYELLFTFCSLRQHRSLTKPQISNSQGRLLDFVSKAAAMNWDAIATSQLPEIEQSFHCQNLLDFVTNKMIDHEDVLMVVTRFDFFSKLVQLKTIPRETCSKFSSVPTYSSPALEFLTSNGIHDNIFKYYLDETAVDNITLSLMSNVHQRYIATYLHLYPEHFLRDSAKVTSVVNTMNKNLDVRPAVWAHGTPPYADLWVLEVLPPQVILNAERGGQNPLVRVPTSPANGAAFHTLGSVFHGPEKASEGIVFPPKDDTHNDDGSNTADNTSDAHLRRYLLGSYLKRHPDFWSNVGSATNILAMEEAALKAILLIKMIATSSWPNPDREVDVDDDNLAYQTGLATLITIGMTAYQALLLPPQPIAGAAGSDASSVAWKIAREKWDALQMLQRLMEAGVGKDEVPHEHWTTVQTSLVARISMGPWGRSADAGSRVQTLEA